MGTHVEQCAFFGHLSNDVFGAEYRHQVQPLNLHLSPFLQCHVHADHGRVPFTHLVRHGLGECRTSNRDRLDYVIVQYGLHAVQSGQYVDPCVPAKEIRKVMTNCLWTDVITFVTSLASFAASLPFCPWPLPFYPIYHKVLPRSWCSRHKFRYPLITLFGIYFKLIFWLWTPWPVLYLRGKGPFSPRRQCSVFKKSTFSGAAIFSR